MKAAWIVLALVLPAVGQAQSLGGASSPAAKKIALAEKALEKSPGSARPYAELALALARRARETADTAYYVRAEEALAKAFRLEPESYEARRARVWVLLGKHEFARALEEARALNRLAPDDLIVYGFLADAHVELGNYAEAEEAAQWMLDMRPGIPAGLTRAAYLRELFGDVEGALDLMRTALAALPRQETEDRAWTLVQIGHLELVKGRLERAEDALAQALELHPGYHYGLGGLARVRAAQGRHAEAVDLLRARYEAAPHPENRFELAQALDRAGRAEEARTAFLDFEREARAEAEGADNANRELIAYYADHGSRPEEALRLARREIARRRDVHTRAVYAWALHRNAQSEEARREMEAALAVGWREAETCLRAGLIALAAGDREAAAGHFRQSLALGARPDVSARARAALAQLAP